MTNQDAIAFAADILEQAHEDIKQALNAPEHAHLLMSVGAGMHIQTNRLRALSGTAHKTKAQAVDFPPITEFMGEELSLPKKVNASDLSPQDAEKAAFLAKVNKLYAGFNELSAETIVNSYTMPDDVVALRGVAKLAGVKDFGTAEITIPFIEAIGAGIKAKEGQRLELEAIEANKRKQTRINDINARLQQITVDREVFTADLVAAEAELAKKPNDKALQKNVTGIQAEIAGSDSLEKELQEELATLEA